MALPQNIRSQNEISIAGMNKLETFASRDELFSAAADMVATRLRTAVAQTGTASFAGAGGGTPKPVYTLLAQDQTVPWDKVQVTLTDERICPPTAGADNATMMKQALLQGPAARAQFVPLEGPDALDAFPPNLSSVLLGMGTDGHFASIFPDGDGMAEAMNTSARLITTTPDPLPPEAPFSRWTLSFDALSRADEILLLITGEEKRAVLKRAAADRPVHSILPVRALLQNDTLPLRILWAA